MNKLNVMSLTLSLRLCSIFPVLNAFGGFKLGKCSTLQAHYNYVYLYQMLARLLSLYQLVLSVFVYVYHTILCASNVFVHENLYQMLAGLRLYIS